MTAQSILPRTAEIWLREEGVVQVESFPDAYDTLEDARANVAAVYKIGLDRRRPLLVDIRLMKGFNQEARAYYASEEVVQMISALALWVESPVSRVLANFFLGLNRVRVPTKLFTSEEEAVAWLKNFIELTERETGESRWREDKK